MGQNLHNEGMRTKKVDLVGGWSICIEIDGCGSVLAVRDGEGIVRERNHCTKIAIHSNSSCFLNDQPFEARETV